MHNMRYELRMSTALGAPNPLNSNLDKSEKNFQLQVLRLYDFVVERLNRVNLVLMQCSRASNVLIGIPAT